MDEADCSGGYIPIVPKKSKKNNDYMITHTKI